MTLDDHRRGDFTPYVLVSEDRGTTFRSIAGDLPTGGPDFAHVIREDPVNENLLFVGTDVGVYVSLDRGGSWQRFMNGLPTVPVRDLKIHPREGDLIAGTHGRSIWIVNITPLQQLDASVMASDAHLFAPAPAYDFGTPPTGGEFTAQAYFLAGNPPSGAQIRYWLADQTMDDVEITISDAMGAKVQTLAGTGLKGWNLATWNLRGQSEPIPLSPSERRDSIATERRLAFVVDSMAAAGTDRDELDQAVQQLHEAGQGGGFGSFGGGGGGGVGNPEVWVDRPAEGRATSGGGGGRGGAGGGPAGGAGASGANLVQEIVRLVRGDTGGRGGRRFGGGGGLFTSRTEPGSVVDPGTYTVTLKVGDRTFTQPLRVLDNPNAPEG